MNIKNILRELKKHRPNVSEFIITDYISICQAENKGLVKQFIATMTLELLLASFDEFCREEYLI